MKRIFDIIFSISCLFLLSPILTLFACFVYLQDFKNPFYMGERIGLNKKRFMMLKLRSMRIDADRLGVDSTANDDERITKIGKVIRKFKIDEIFQLWNVAKGEMSIVGPRPNVEKDVEIYTKLEEEIISIKPGITDFSSIVFSDEGDILAGSSEPDLLYNQLIRPWKSRLAIFYVQNNNVYIDIKIILLTIISLFNKKKALNYIIKTLKSKNVDENLLRVVSRNYELQPFAPPGSTEIVKKR